MSSAALPIPCIQGDKGPVNIGISATFLAISIILTGLRIFTRISRVTAGLGWDDASIVTAVVSAGFQVTTEQKINQSPEVFAITTFSLTARQFHHGLGQHIGCLSKANIILTNKIQAVGEIPIMLSTLFSRVSVCLFLLRIFSVNLSWRWTLYIIIALTVATNVACGAAILLQCQPRAKLWNPTISGECWSSVDEVAIGQIQGGKSVTVETPQLSQRG